MYVQYSTYIFSPVPFWIETWFMYKNDFTSRALHSCPKWLVQWAYLCYVPPYPQTKPQDEGPSHCDFGAFIQKGSLKFETSPSGGQIGTFNKGNVGPSTTHRPHIYPWTTLAPPNSGPRSPGTAVDSASFLHGLLQADRRRDRLDRKREWFYNLWPSLAFL